jgi:hypothetical protein
LRIIWFSLVSSVSYMLQYLVSANVLGANVLVSFLFQKEFFCEKNFALDPMGSLAFLGVLPAGMRLVSCRCMVC